MIDAPVDAPNLSGCADGEREAFPSLGTFPTIAGCDAAWDNTADLRAARSNSPCGDDLVGKCNAPVDACAPGWHVCGTAGDPTELSSRVTQDECAAAGAANAVYAVAMSHCTSVCAYNLPLPCAPAMDCSEPVCCGGGCRIDQGCLTAVYTITAVVSNNLNGCGNLLGSSVTGVLCCQ